jgi:hypothetical protein
MATATHRASRMYGWGCSLGPHFGNYQAGGWPFRLHATYEESIDRFLGIFELHQHAMKGTTVLTGAAPPVGGSNATETAIRPRSVISGYPIPPAYTLSRYDEDYSYLANLTNRTVGP